MCFVFLTTSFRWLYKLFLEPLKEYIDARLANTLAEIAKCFNRGINAVFEALCKLGHTYKKTKNL